MKNLDTIYSEIRPIKKDPFNIDNITDTLMAEPIGVDLNNIVHTPVAVIVNLPREEYTKRNIGMSIMKQYDTTAICRDEMLIFRSTMN
jgi:hypothetical protein